MDIFLFVLILVIIGLFFFLDKYSTTSNPVYFVVLFSLLGWFLLLNTNIELIDYSTVNKINDTQLKYANTDLTDVGFGPLTVQTFFLLAFWTFLIIGIINLVIGKKDMRGND